MSDACREYNTPCDYESCRAALHAMGRPCMSWTAFRQWWTSSTPVAESCYCIAPLLDKVIDLLRVGIQLPDSMPARTTCCHDCCVVSVPPHQPTSSEDPRAVHPRLVIKATLPSTGKPHTLSRCCRSRIACSHWMRSSGAFLISSTPRASTRSYHSRCLHFNGSELVRRGGQH